MRFRVLALLPIVLFLPSLYSFAFSEPGVVWPEYTGVFFHLSILLLIARLDAPEWARAAGYGWIAIDVVAGILAINAVEYDIRWPVRLGGHVLAGVWIATASLYARHRVVQVVGVVTGVWLGGYSFVADVAPEEALYPAGLLIVVWFGLLAALYVTVGAQARRTVSTATYTAICYTAAAVALVVTTVVAGQPLAGVNGQISHTPRSVIDVQIVYGANLAILGVDGLTDQLASLVHKILRLAVSTLLASRKVHR